MIRRSGRDSMKAPSLHASAADGGHIRDQESVKRALEIGAAGGHNILLIYAVIHSAEVHLSHGL